MSMKLVVWNIENLLPRLAELPAFVATLGEPEIVCLQEIRVRAQDADNVAALERALPGYRCHFSLPRDPRNVTYRGGRAYGVATFVKGRATGSVPAWDREGRVVVVRRGKLAVVNVYAVNGTDRPYLDETGRVDGDRHELKRRFQAQVFELARELRRDGPVILAGDWNVSRAKIDAFPRLRTEGPHAQARAELNALIEREGFVDVWRARNLEARGYTWFNRRARGLDAARVDYILVSEDLAPRVRDAAILDLHPWSDHAPITLDLGPVRGR
jgi:exodeoxyribonuclease-3